MIKIGRGRSIYTQYSKFCRGRCDIKEEKLSQVVNVGKVANHTHIKSISTIGRDSITKVVPIHIHTLIFIEMESMVRVGGWSCFRDNNNVMANFLCVQNRVWAYYLFR